MRIAAKVQNAVGISHRDSNKMKYIDIAFQIIPDE